MRDHREKARWQGGGAAVSVAAILGLLSAIGDWIWFHFLEDGALAPALGHGVLFFVALAVTLGAATGGPRTIRRLLATLPLVGLGLAGVFYPLASLAGYLVALLLTWTGMWVALAALLAWAAARRDAEIRTIGLRAVVATVGSGLAFWTVSWMWTAPDPAGPSIPVHFLCWTFALTPGIFAIVLRRSSES